LAEDFFGAASFAHLKITRTGVLNRNVLFQKSTVNLVMHHFCVEIGSLRRWSTKQDASS
jgi:hypothetical protein